MMRADAACKLTLSIGLHKEEGKGSILQYSGHLLVAPLVPLLHDSRRLSPLISRHDCTGEYNPC
jgi:hypothetical protein